jgi:hypothetical protein
MAPLGRSELMRDWIEQRVELLAHVDELRERASRHREDASTRQLEQGFGETIAQHWHAEATRLDLAVTVPLGAVQLADDQIREAE